MKIQNGAQTQDGHQNFIIAHHTLSTFRTLTNDKSTKELNKTSPKIFKRGKFWSILYSTQRHFLLGMSDRVTFSSHYLLKQLQLRFSSIANKEIARFSSKEPMDFVFYAHSKLIFCQLIAKVIYRSLSREKTNSI
jgi:hypothetical protein